MTVTPGEQPVILGSDLRPGQHLAVLGADVEGKSEVELGRAGALPPVLRRVASRPPAGGELAGGRCGGRW